MSEITLEELNRLNGDEYQLIDIRNEISFEYGRIDGAVNVHLEKLDNFEPDTNKKIKI